MKKKIIYISISILLVLGIILSINSTPKDKIYLNKNKIENNNKSIAIYLENSSGNYDKTTTFPIKESGYVLNTSKSVCNGSTNISWNNEEWGLELDNIDREETKCYLYFDKGKTIDNIIATLNAKTETPDFSQVATTDEGVYAVEDGMYGGTSYYWRGAATTNYLKFAGFCWRIVRINGDKTMRLIYDGTTCHANGTNDANSIAKTSQAYNPSYDRSEYVGWTYSTGSQRTTGGSPSNIKTQTDSWFTSNITGTNAEKVADGKFCNDRDTASGSTWSSQPSSTFYYAAYGRLVPSKTPTLACPTSDVYTMKAGAITIDEVAYAGGVYGSSNSSYYLYNGQYYWTMSPLNWSGSNAQVFAVYDDGYLAYYSVSNTTPGVRPVINLKADTLFNNGTGTIDNPYEVM